MPNLVHVTYDQTGKSKSTNPFGMREMQEKAYEGRTAQYLLLKAPPASGKSLPAQQEQARCLSGLSNESFLPNKMDLSTIMLRYIQKPS